MKYLLKCLFLFGLLLAFTSCFSLMKADRLIHYGSIGKKPDAVVIDSIVKVDLSDY